MSSVLILIGGGHASGKRTMAHMLSDTVKTTWIDASIEISIWDMEKYNTEKDNQAAVTSYSAIAIDSTGNLAKKPSRYDIGQLKKDLKDDMSKIPSGSQKIYFVHGLYALYDKELREMSQIKVFMSSDPDTRLVRWIRRDVVEGNSSLDSVIFSYLKGARQEMQDFIFPTKEMADVIMPRGAEHNAASLIVDGIVSHLTQKPLDKLYAGGASLRPTSSNVFGGEVLDNQKATFYDLT